MKAAILALATEDLATHRLAANLANALRSAGRTTTLIWASVHSFQRIAPPSVVSGIDVVAFHASGSGDSWSPDFPLFELSRQLAPQLGSFEIVYGLIQGHPMMHAVRKSRFSPQKAPLHLAILNEDTSEPRAIALGADAIARRLGERYTAAHCDLILDFAASGGERSTSYGLSGSDRRVLDADIETFPAKLAAIETAARTARSERTARNDSLSEIEQPSVTIFVTQTELTGDITRTLEALERQTSRAFSVVAIDTGTSVKSSAVFVELAERYSGRGWTFRREAQSGEARAIALSIGTITSRYLMFMDADDAPEPGLVDRALDAAELTGDDLLEIWSNVSSSPDSQPQAGGTGSTSARSTVAASYGLDLVNALNGTHQSNSLFIVRRTAFEAVGGYPQGLVAGHERTALALRIAMAGHRTDVLPEILNTRHSAGTTKYNAIREGEALRRAFDEQLNRFDLQSFAMAAQSIAQQRQIVEAKLNERRLALKRCFLASKRQGLKLLMLVSNPPYPPIAGGLLRWWAMIRFLGQRHDLTLVTFGSPQQSRKRHQLLRYCQSVYAASWDGAELAGSEGLPYLVRARRRSTMRDALRAIPTHLYDAALVEQIVLAQFAEEIEAPAILGEHNIESRLLEQSAQAEARAPLTDTFDNAQYQADLMRQYEDRMWPRFAMRSAVNPRERDEIQRRAGTGQTILVENGTNPDLWLEHAGMDTNRILFLGMLGYYPNTDGIMHFWQDIWPHLIRRRPSARFIAAGSAATPELRELAKQPGFTLVETPADIREVAALASLTVVPLRLGAGTRLKILDSMALGLPVVSTSLGCEGLALEDGEHLLIRDDPKAFAEAIDEVLSNRGLWQRLRRNGRIAVEERYSWNRVLAPLEPALLGMAR